VTDDSRGRDDSGQPDHGRTAAGGQQNIEQRLEQTILELLDRRAPTSTICPSDAARAVGGDDWRGLMDASRGSAARLVARGEVEITQGGEPVDLATARGPIRIRRLRPKTESESGPEHGPESESKPDAAP
jgi:hypothetical protein